MRPRRSQLLTGPIAKQKACDKPGLCSLNEFLASQKLYDLFLVDGGAGRLEPPGTAPRPGSHGPPHRSRYIAILSR